MFRRWVELLRSRVSRASTRSISGHGGAATAGAGAGAAMAGAGAAAAGAGAGAGVGAGAGAATGAGTGAGAGIGAAGFLPAPVSTEERTAASGISANDTPSGTNSANSSVSTPAVSCACWLTSSKAAVAAAREVSAHATHVPLSATVDALRT